jgi:molybdate transport system substrate-binding protein
MIASRRRASALAAIVAMAVFASCGSSSSSSSSSASSTPSGSINVSAAASLNTAFDEIGKAYMAAHPGVTVKFNYGGSNTLAQQIGQGAPVDVFASADTANMQKVASEMNTSKTFATNKVEVMVPAANPAKIQTLHDLANPGVKIAVADAAVPVGDYTNQVLDKMGASSEYGPSYVTAVKANFVTHETSVGGIVQKVELGEVDAGYTYVSDVVDSGSKVMGIEIPDTYNIVADYPIATAKSSKNAVTAESFVAYVLSPDGQKTLQKYGFQPVPSGG